MRGSNELQVIVGQRIRIERERLGYSQEEFATAAGLDRTYLSGVERGVRNITLRVLSLIAAALEVAPSDLLTERSLERHDGVAYLVNRGFSLNCGFLVQTRNVVEAAQRANSVLTALPMSLFTTVDLKTQSGMIGAVFVAELANVVGAIPNPIEKGHPDIVPSSAANASESSLRHFPEGLEIKCTLGQVVKGSGLSAGEERVKNLSGIVWQAHHRDVRALMGLAWDFVGGRKGDLRHPAITAVFFNDQLQESDWGAISGTTGRNTKVTGMTVSGRRKMAAGVIAITADPVYLNRYASCLGTNGFSMLETIC